MSRKLKKAALASIIALLLTFAPIGINAAQDSAQAYNGVTPCGEC